MTNLHEHTAHLAHTDWSSCGATPLRAVAAEAATAELSWRENPDTRWIGGHRKAVDVYGDHRRDAKAVRLDKEDFVVLARRNAKPFDPVAVDRLTLAHMGPATTGWKVDLDAGVVHLHAVVPIEQIWDVPTAACNAVMPTHAADDPTWRNVHLDPAALAPYRVI